MRDTWAAAEKAQAVACVEAVRASGGTLDLAIPEYNGDAPLFDPNAVVVQLLDYHFGLDFLQAGGLD